MFGYITYCSTKYLTLDSMYVQRVYNCPSSGEPAPYKITYGNIFSQNAHENIVFQKLKT